MTGNAAANLNSNAYELLVFSLSREHGAIKREISKSKDKLIVEISVCQCLGFVV